MANVDYYASLVATERGGLPRFARNQNHLIARITSDSAIYGLQGAHDMIVAQVRYA